MCSDHNSQDYPTLQVSSRKLRNASGALVPRDGDKHLGVRLGVDKNLRIVRTAVADVSKNLLAVSALVDAGHDVKFTKNRSTIKHVATGAETEMVRRNGIWEIDVELVPFSEMQRLVPPPPPPRQ